MDAPALNAIVIVAVVVVVIALVLGLYMLGSYKSLTALKDRVDEAWRDITAQLQHRADLLPRVVAPLRGPASHEKAVFQSVAEAQEESLAASTPGQATVAENHVQQALRSVFAVAEGYPRVSASQDFLQLQGDLADTEERIQASRRFYNGGVRELNTKIQVFPNRLFARRLGFGDREFFEVADGGSVAQPPRVQF